MPVGAAAGARRRESVRVALYDLSRDPGATENLAAIRADVLLALLDRLDAFQPQVVSPPVEQILDQRLEERLRALGYLR